MNTSTHLDVRGSSLAKFVAAILCASLLGGYASAQVQSQPASDQTTTTTTTTTTVASTDQSNQDQVVTLTPFDVKPGDDNGYMSSSTMSGTRLRTDLRDVASSVSVVNRTLMDDLNAHNLETLLNYTLGTEVAGLGGNFSDAAIEPGFYGLVDNHANSTNAFASTRVRGLQSADLTRDFFLSVVPTDDYNIDRIEISRGANAMLFGLGSPAGIINSSLITANTDKNAYQLSESYSSYGSNRVVLDANQVIFKDKLAIRLATEYSKSYYEIHPSFEENQKMYLTATYRPFKNTTVRVSTEWGDKNSNEPELSPPFDGYNMWWEIGKPIWNGSTNTGQLTAVPTLPGVISAAPGVVGNQNTMYPNENNNYIRQGIGNLGSGNNSWAVVYSDQNSSVPGIPGYPGVIGMRVGYDSTHNLAALNYANRALVQSTALTLPQDASFWFFQEVTNPKVYNFFNYQLDGSNKYEDSNWKTYNVTATQTFLNNHAGIEVAFDRENVFSGFLQPENFWGYWLQMDFNTNLLNGAPNPNFGRAFVQANNGSIGTTQDNRDTERETAFYDLDLRRVGGPSWLGEVLGHHVFTLTNTYFRRYTESHGTSGLSDSIDYAQLVGKYSPPGNAPTVASTGRLLGVLQYMGGNNSALATPGSVPATLVGQWPTNYLSANILFAPNATTANPNPTWSTINTGIVSPGRYMGNPEDDIYASKHQDVFSSTSFVAQDYWFGGNLVSTVGWRNDQYRSYDAGSAPVNPVTGAVVTNPIQYPLAPVGSGGLGTKNWGLVGHAPDFITHKLPFGMDISLIYNKADNFQPTSQRFDLFGNPIAPVSGITDEYGARVSFFNDKIDFKYTHYKSSDSLNNDNNININQMVLVMANVLGNDNSSNPAGEVAFLNFLNSPAGKNFTSTFQFKFGPPIPGQNGLPSLISYNGRNGTVVATQDTTSRGDEYEVGLNPLPNWRIGFNANRAVAINDNSAAQAQIFTNNVLKPLIAGPAGQLITDSAAPLQLDIQGEFINALNADVLQDGRATQELRKWHWNLYTNYTFTQEKLKGFGIGGAVRWMDKIAIGFPVLNDPVLGPLPDVRHPFYGPTQTNFDGWLSYSRALPYHIMWKAQFNLTNIGIGNKLIPINAQPTGVTAAWRIAEPQRWSLTNTFSF